MSAYNLFSQCMSYFCRYSTCFIVFIPRPVTTSFDRFFVFFFFFTVLVHGPCILKLSGTGLVHGPSKKGNRTETGLDFKALTKWTTRPFDREQLWRAAATEPEPEHKTPHTTDTQDNFATVPEIMKEFKCLVDAVLKPLWTHGVCFSYT